MRKNIVYIIIVVLIIIDTIFISINYLNINKSISGTSIVNNKYSSILFGNVYNDKDNVIIKLNNDNNSISVSIKELESLNNGILFYFDMVNIGNENVNIDKGISNYDSNISSNLINIKLSDSDVILGSETKRFYVTYDKSNNSIDKNSYLNFNINFNFD